MRLAIFIHTALLALAIPAAAAAQQGRNHGHDAPSYNPQRGYIVFRSDEDGVVQFAREVTEDRRGDWAARRAAAFAKALADYRRDLPALRIQEQQCRGSPAVECQNRQPIPDMPTEENFEYGALAAGDIVTATSLQSGDKDRPGILYAEVEPGSYILYGQVAVMGGNGNLGVCLCMGSVRFQVGAGQIVDIGELRFPLRHSNQAGPTFGPDRLASMELVPPTTPMAPPELFAGHQIIPAQLHAAGKMINDYHVEIDRLPAIPGVLGYDRDRVIDLAAAGTP